MCSCKNNQKNLSQQSTNSKSNKIEKFFLKSIQDIFNINTNSDNEIVNNEVVLKEQQ